MRQDRTSSTGPALLTACPSGIVHWSRMAMLAIAMLMSVALPARAADVLCGFVFAGDLNGDNLINAVDVQIYDAAVANGEYLVCADLTRNGVLDPEDRKTLLRLLQFSSSGVLGQGGKGRVPNFTISELRVGVSDPSIASQQRYVEFRVPALPADYLWNKTFGNGYYLLFMSKDGTVASAQGVIRAVLPLQGVEFAATGPSAGLALLTDPTYSLPVPPGAARSQTTAALTFTGFRDLDINVALVYRRPSESPYTSAVQVPAVNQRVDRNNNCEWDARFFPGFPPVNGQGQLPPWDVVLDVFSLARVTPTTPNEQTFGCLYGREFVYGNGPVTDANGDDALPLHAFRCVSDRGVQSGQLDVQVGWDTPGLPNRGCDAGNLACGSSDAGSCLKPHGTPYCNDELVCIFVCATNPLCCSVSWDASCVAIADTATGCGGPATGGCFAEHGNSPYCSIADCCESVCARDPTCCIVGWDAGCVTLAIAECISCGDADAGSCFIPRSTPYCSDGVCCNSVCAVDPACCSTVWDQPCVDFAGLVCQQLACGSAQAASCCLSHNTPFCSDAECCKTVCAIDPFCCEGRWDTTCVSEAITFCATVSCVCGGGGPAADCFMEHVAPGCNRLGCCDSVCLADPFCCVATWDASCVAAARVFCAENPACGQVGSGSCLVPHASPGCDDGGCCDAVCRVRPECCTITWDAVCVKLVAAECEGCGSAFAGECTTTHLTPACADRVCCETVCDVDVFCCSEAWDTLCVEMAQSMCGTAPSTCGSAGTRPCFVPSFVPGCNDSSSGACCEVVCEILDPFCCSVQWDAICVQQAFSAAAAGLGSCSLPPTGSGFGNCLAAHGGRGCANRDCSASVCSVDRACCLVAWDEGCAAIAEVVCIAANTCPGAGDCLSVGNGPGCADGACCNGVCAQDPSCCNDRWDQACVTLARTTCLPFATWRCPCAGSCFEPHANGGCDDATCCAVVCRTDPNCCVIEWDIECSSLARGLCCGLPGCGNGCNGSCLLAHDTPYCDDPACCATVCAQDPFCCLSAWDAFCVEYALERCSKGCGVTTSGSCFVPRPTGGCAQGDCCIAVCQQDVFCCDTAWDDVCVQMAQASCPDDVPSCGNATGNCCEAHLGLACEDESCCAVVCAADPVCCEGAWDSACATRARTLCPDLCGVECGDECAGDCCTAHDNPSCNDASCCAQVCAADPVCCEARWDFVCANTARALCGGPNDACPRPQCGDKGSGDCCTPHEGPACENRSCCSSVCAQDPICCQVTWDIQCAGIAASIKSCECGETFECGAAAAGSCFKPRDTPFCDNFACCAIVCKIDPNCCQIAWDQTCVDFATSGICP